LFWSRTEKRRIDKLSRSQKKNEFTIKKEQFEELTDKLDTLIKVAAASIFRGEKLKEGIIFLTDLGLTAKETAKILGTTEHYVWNVNFETKKQKKKPETTEKDRSQEQGTATTV
jgi:hypothetical protein